MNTSVALEISTRHTVMAAAMACADASEGYAGDLVAVSIEGDRVVLSGPAWYVGLVAHIAAEWGYVCLTLDVIAVA